MNNLKELSETSWGKITIPCLSGVLIALNIPYLSAIYAGFLAIILGLFLILMAYLYLGVEDRQRREALQRVYVENKNKPIIDAPRYVGMLGFSVCLTIAANWWLLGIWAVAVGGGYYIRKDANNTFERK